MTDTTIQQGSKVTLHFSLRLSTGELIDGNFDQSPATLTIGDGTLFNGFESVLLGMAAGQAGSFTLPPEKAFGVGNDANIQRFKRAQFAGEALAVGTVMSFADAAKAELPGVVKALEGDEVVVDFNHPLAGKTLQFEVSIIEVQA